MAVVRGVARLSYEKQAADDDHDIERVQADDGLPEGGPCDAPRSSPLARSTHRDVAATGQIAGL
jgi:hypothetical protein